MGYVKTGKIATLIVIRINSKGELCNSKPCKNCILSIRKHSHFYNLKKIIYSDDLGQLIKTDINIIENMKLYFFTQ